MEDNPSRRVWILDTAPKKTFAAYPKELEGLHGTEKLPSKIHGDGLFVTKDVGSGKYIMAYIVISRSGASARALHRAFDYRNLCSNDRVKVNVDDGE